jgi:hypothetical protein
MTSQLPMSAASKAVKDSPASAIGGFETHALESAVRAIVDAVADVCVGECAHTRPRLVGRFDAASHATR